MAFPIVACSLLLLFHTHGVFSLGCHVADTLVVKGVLTSSGDLQGNGYVFTPNFYEAVNGTHYRVCICTVEKCVQKCCGLGMAYNSSNQCAPTNKSTEFSVYDNHLRLITSNPTSIFQLVHGNMCAGKYRLDPASYPTDEYYLIKNGDLFLPNAENGPQNYTPDIFCIDNIVTQTSVQSIVLACFIEEKPEVVFTAYPVGIIISIPFLVITLLVYALLPDLRNLNGKNLMCQVASMIVAYSFLASLQLSDTKIERKLCVASAYIMQYAFLATFFWLNVTSYDLWWTFGGFGGILLTRHRDTLKFVFYSLYAWGGPLVLIAITVGMDLSPNLPNYIIRPQMAVSKCWFADDSALFSYFYGPIAAILVINMIFFALTAYKIFAVNKEANNVLGGDNSRRSSEASKQKFFLYLKLFFVMGVNWIMEVVSAAYEDPEMKYLFIVTDICNALQGVLICYFFVGATKTKELIRSTFRSSVLSHRTTATTSSARGILIFFIFIFNVRTKKRLMARFGFKPERETTTMATSYSSRHSSLAMRQHNEPSIIDPNRKISINANKTTEPVQNNH